MSTTEDKHKLARLKRIKWLATALLIAVAALYALATSMADHGPIWAYVAAFAEASMVGAIADWFAVTALFRHPFGLRFIPHTAIIPRNKDRIADNLGEFIQGEFFAPERIASVIRELDPAGKAAAWLSTQRKADTAADTVGQALSYVLGALDEQAVRTFLDKSIAGVFKEVDLSSLAAHILQAVTHDGRHQELLDQALHQLNTFINQEHIKTSFSRQLAEKVPLYFKTVKASVANNILEKMLESLADLLADIEHDREHPLRAQFDAAIQDYTRKLQVDPVLKASIARYQEGLVSNPLVGAYVHGLWSELYKTLRQDLLAPHSRIRSQLSRALMHLGKTLAEDAAMQHWINEQILTRIPALLDRLRPRIGALVADKVREWKDHEVVNKLELNIGHDLQYIRINGTLVGGLVGLLIHAITQAFH